MKKLSIQLPEELVTQLDYCIDGVQFRSRNQLIHIICSEWLEQNHDRLKGQMALNVSKRKGKRKK